MRVAKTKALISFAVTSKLICVFVFVYADCWFSHEAARMFYIGLNLELIYEGLCGTFYTLFLSSLMTCFSCGKSKMCLFHVNITKINTVFVSSKL